MKKRVGTVGESPPSEWGGGGVWLGGGGVPIYRLLFFSLRFVRDLKNFLGFNFGRGTSNLPVVIFLFTLIFNNNIEIGGGGMVLERLEEFCDFHYFAYLNILSLNSLK